VRKIAAASLALVLVGALISIALLRGDDDGSREPSATPSLPTPVPVPAPPSPRLLVGFFDDANFRWRPYRARMLDKAHGTGARVIRAFIRWHLAAPTRPLPKRRPFNEPSLHEIDELVAAATARNMEVLFSIWGTPSWANGGLGPNHPPTSPDDLRRFAHALAERYPQVRRYAVWNEPNTELFLAPQFDAEGRSVAPRLYAHLYRAAYEGIKAASPDALVAIGETSSNGRDAPSPGRAQDRHSPARFARLLAAERPRLRFDAWGHHPYPVRRHLPPDLPSGWPSVTMTSLDRFGRALDRWFGRKRIPLWITEYGYECSPDEPRGITPGLQAAYAARALALAAAVRRVTLFVWFTFRDDESNAWQSGLLDRRGRPRPAYEGFAAAIRGISATSG
jgi:hypothetical protein